MPGKVQTKPGQSAGQEPNQTLGWFSSASGSPFCVSWHLLQFSDEKKTSENLAKIGLDVAFDPGDYENQDTSLFAEIQLKLLYLHHPLDIIVLGRTCRFYPKYADNEQLR